MHTELQYCVLCGLIYLDGIKKKTINTKPRRLPPGRFIFLIAWKQYDTYNRSYFLLGWGKYEYALELVTRYQNM